MACKSYVSLTHKCEFTLHEPVFIYRTIEQAASGEYREKGSKFLSFAFPVISEEEIEEKLMGIKKKYFDARHHCYGWMLGTDRVKFRAYDDGEPKHSAGDPILGQIKSNELTNVLIVVVRYFGGVKLGVGGLVNAYRTAASEAIKNATIVNREVLSSLTIEYDFACTPELMRLVKEFNLTLEKQSFDKKATMEVTCPLADTPLLVEKLELLKNLKMDISFSVTE